MCVGGGGAALLHFYQTFAWMCSNVGPQHDMPNQTSDFRLYTHSCGGDHNAVQHSVTKLSMGQVAARIWTEVQKGKAKEMLLVALRKCGRLGEKTSVV